MDGHDVAGRASEHFLSVCADLEQLARVFIHGKNGGLAQGYALAVHEKLGGGGTQIYCDVSFN